MFSLLQVEASFEWYPVVQANLALYAGGGGMGREGERWEKRGRGGKAKVVMGVQ